MRKYLWLTILIAILTLIIYNFLISISEGKEYSANEICNAIYIIEGKERANQPYGINPKYIICKTEKECRKICINTVNNNRKRFANQKKEKDYLTFLAKRYCSPNWRIWLKNLKYFLARP